MNYHFNISVTEHTKLSSAGILKNAPADIPIYRAAADCTKNIH